MPAWRSFGTSRKEVPRGSEGRGDLGGALNSRGLTGFHFIRAEGVWHSSNSRYQRNYVAVSPRLSRLVYRGEVGIPSPAGVR